MNKKISIITPTYDEAKNIKKLASRINKSLSNKNYELIIIDDNSPDGTGEIAEELSKKYPVRVIHRKRRLGLSSAVIEGFKAAEGYLICVIDADLSHPPEIIPKLTERLKTQTADIVIASRLIEGGGTENWPKKRKITSFIATALARPLTNVNDLMSGFFLIKKEVIKNVKLIPRGYKILLEILVKGRYKKIVEYPFIFKDRTAGSSKLNFKTNLEYLRQLVHLYLCKIYKNG